MRHIPVLATEVMEALQPAPGGIYLDATLGAGGHAKLILEHSQPDGRVIGFDRDDRNLAIAKENLAEFEGRVQFIHDSYAGMGNHQLPPVDGALFDLGFSSMHVDEAERGFSFQADGPLDMRYNTAQTITAESIVNGSSKEELADLIHVYGEDPLARHIAKAIFDARKQERITRTSQLAEVIAGAIRRSGKQHPATKTFQALRIAVNDEFGHINMGLAAAVAQLKPGGVLAVISFHSLEDRIVKQFFKESTDLELLTKKAIQPSWSEKQTNPRSRSAKLRTARKK